MKRLHQMVGIVALVAFLGTGMYMRAQFPDIYNSNETIRMMFRANHIYFLLAALLNMAIGSYLEPRPGGWRRLVQRAGSALILAATPLLLWAFFTEPVRGSMNRPITLWAVVLLLSGTLGHLVSGVRLREPRG